LKIFLIIFLVIIILISLFFIVVVDAKLLFWYIVDKKNIRYKVVREFTNKKQKILILGTLHYMHHNLPNYSFYHLKAVLENVKPDLLLIESRQEEINIGNLADGPLEMFYLHMIAKELNIPVRGVDWFSFNETKPGTTNKLRDKVITENIMKESKEYTNILVAIGATHMLVESKRLTKIGYDRQKLTRTQLDSLFETKDTTFSFPDNTREYIKFRIERETAALTTRELPKKWKEVLENSIKSLGIFINKLN